MSHQMMLSALDASLVLVVCLMSYAVACEPCAPAACESIACEPCDHACQSYDDFSLG